MSILLPSVRCKTCDYPPSVIILPYPDPPGALQGAPEWPSANWKSNLACQECGSDEQTGWSGDAEAWAGDLPAGQDDDEDFD